MSPGNLQERRTKEQSQACRDRLGTPPFLQGTAPNATGRPQPPTQPLQRGCFTPFLSLGLRNPAESTAGSWENKGSARRSGAPPSPVREPVLPSVPAVPA